MGLLSSVILTAARHSSSQPGASETFNAKLWYSKKSSYGTTGLAWLDEAIKSNDTACSQLNTRIPEWPTDASTKTRASGGS